MKEKDIESEIKRIEGIIENVQDTVAIISIPGSERFVAFLRKTRDFFKDRLSTLDAYSDPHKLSKDYVKYQFVVNEIDKITGLFGNSTEILDKLKTDRIKLISELSKIKDEQKDREKKMF